MKPDSIFTWFKGTNAEASYTEWKRRDRILSKRWHLSSTQLGVVLGTTGGFWLLVGIFIAVRFLLTWGCMGTWR